MTTTDLIARLRKCGLEGLPDDFAEQFRQRCYHDFMPVLDVDTGEVGHWLCAKCGDAQPANVVAAVEAAGRGGT